MFYDFIIVLLTFFMLLNSIAWLGVAVLLFKILLDHQKNQEEVKKYMDNFNIKKFFNWGAWDDKAN